MLVDGINLINWNYFLVNKIQTPVMEEWVNSELTEFRLYFRILVLTGFALILSFII